jgi:hypothetical protein
MSCPNVPTVGHPLRPTSLESRQTCPRGGGEACGNDTRKFRSQSVFSIIEVQTIGCTVKLHGTMRHFRERFFGGRGGVICGGTPAVRSGLRARWLMGSIACRCVNPVTKAILIDCTPKARSLAELKRSILAHQLRPGGG